MNGNSSDKLLFRYSKKLDNKEPTDGEVQSTLSEEGTMIKI